MGAKNTNVLELVSGWEAVEQIFKCIFIGLWQFIKISVKRFWKGHRRKSLKDHSPVELTVDSSIGTHCYIKIMGVKYHYVASGPKNGQVVLILGDAPDNGNLWCPTWSAVVRRLMETGYYVVSLDLRGTGGSEGGARWDLSPPQAVAELSALMKAIGVSQAKPAVVIGFGIGGMLSWYLAHCHGHLISKMAVIGAPHPNLYWQNPPAVFCNGVLHFIQWPYLPERWLAEGELQDGENGRWASSRACDWTGALNYLRGAAWWRIRAGHLVEAPVLLVGATNGALLVVASTLHCSASKIRLVEKPDPTDEKLPAIMLDFLIETKDTAKKQPQEVSRSIIRGLLGAVADRGRELTSKLVNGACNVNSSLVLPVQG
ncbi:epoxide hydrolase 4-like [Galleria mellonella]|uniref:Epoxide hydrolase 4-like n=1 Tax=Galleria mellonella TaxID=7137 RepID=A0ABM3MU47_GALME|nr:epoxide hydrolase 4-like [Galleria mellonella]